MNFLRLKVGAAGTALMLACWTAINTQHPSSVLEMPFSGNIFSNEVIHAKILGILLKDVVPSQIRNTSEHTISELRSRIHKANQTMGLLRLEAAASYESELDIATQTEEMRADILRLEKHSDGAILPALKSVNLVLRNANADAAKQARAMLINLATQIANQSVSLNGSVPCPGHACNSTSQVRKKSRDSWFQKKVSEAEINVFDHIPTRLYTGQYAGIDRLGYIG